MDQLFLRPEIEFVFVGGKGGVGKTTSSCAIALQFAHCRGTETEEGGKVLLISTDPAHNLADAFRQPFSAHPTLVEGTKNLYAMETDPQAVLHSEVQEITSGLEDQMISDFKSWITSVPGIDEAIALSTVLKYVESGTYDVIVFDTAPTGHTLRLLQLPEVLKAGIAKLNSWKAKLTSVLASVGSMFFSSNPNEVNKQEAMHALEAKLREYEVGVSKISEIFTDPRRTEFICVCIAEHLSVYETKRLCHQLAKNQISSKYLLVNQLIPPSMIQMDVPALVTALEQSKADDNLIAQARTACELCHARASMQQHYLEEISKDLGSTHTIIRLPLLPSEVC
eukprot:Pompholyxophrys_punicea_v1_NODE_580_length_1654_cov_3.301438.p1 type:complete len:338 gc:universal NODE_580_length_1654_cov_3.301438:1061-48(-)